VGGGPAGSFFAFFLLDIARRVGLDLAVDIYESRDFSIPGPAGCNMCGGVVSESLVQALAAEGIDLPSSVVERGIDSYVLHMEEGSVHIRTPLAEMRIAAVHRGAGPRGITASKWSSFDDHLLQLAAGKGANLVRRRVENVTWEEGRPSIRSRDGPPGTYDLLAIAAGVNTPLLALLETGDLGYRPPRTTKTYICEIFLGQDEVKERFGNSMHVFLLDLPRLEFAALVPKGDYVTMCLLGREIDRSLVETFFASREVKACLPPGWSPPENLCHCSPRMSVRGAVSPFADRMVFIGDSGVTRLYKDGIGAAYRTAKSAAVTAIFDGISVEDFRRRYGKVCRSIQTDNAIGRIMFAVAAMQRNRPHDCRGILRMVAKEQETDGADLRMSMVMWDIFTGSAPYSNVFLRTLHPFFWGRLLWEVLMGAAVGPRPVREGT
jgi:flavin-dependent dehydrogenase